MRKQAGAFLILAAILLAVAFVAPVAAQDDTSAEPGCAAPMPLQIGDIIFVRGGVNIRNNPTLSGGLVNRTTGILPDFRIIDGPVCADGFNWWKVSAPGNDGWLAEGPWLQPQRQRTVEELCGAALTIPTGTPTELLTGLRVRDAANLGGRVLTVAPVGSMAVVLDGPICADEIYWWQIQVMVLGVEYTGYVAQGRFGANFLLPENLRNLPQCRPPERFDVGDRVEVIASPGRPRPLLAAPGFDSTLVATLLNNIGAQVIGSPVCADDMNWWPIQVLSRPDVLGWMAEGGTGAIYLRLIEVPDGGFPGN